MQMQIAPDWSITYTKEEAENELTDFTWHGPGLYVTSTDSLIVVPINRPQEETWHQADKVVDEVYMFHVWNCDITEMLNTLHHIPSRVSPNPFKEA